MEKIFKFEGRDAHGADHGERLLDVPLPRTCVRQHEKLTINDGGQGGDGRPSRTSSFVVNPEKMVIKEAQRAIPS
jgi:hypothetical protein